jgi:hypothetical protein
VPRAWQAAWAACALLMPASWARTKPLARWVAYRPLGPLGRKQAAGAAIFFFYFYFIYSKILF